MNTGLVLSGGGVRGIAHIGVIKALEEHHIYPSYIAGTSAGAIVGGLYAGGCSWQQILEFFNATQLFSLSNYAMNKPGFLDTEKFYNQFKKYLPVDDYKALKIPLVVTATNLLDGTLKVFDTGSLIKTLLASAAVPGVFAPVEIDGGYYADGGILNNFPVDLIKHKCDQIVGVYVNPFQKIEKDSLKHVYNIMERSYHIMLANETSKKFKDCDVLIRPNRMKEFSTFSMKNNDTIFNLGYESAIASLEKNKENKKKTLDTINLEVINGFSITH
ncbi:patatin-like phospholipase family protein [Cellulophaga sp. E16_2]|uniref:patatin-like phospholipase family protein n=1 Tax=unclassified Cellulophaga TaxID=2634405 RepID=UPI0013FDC691|nr:MULTISPECIES: patatin-like phospholipase family protein [unclassified Cellulophaga]MBO0592713.1 patatin-like phospholipase family protein [Cellulophaga sp. E16_2]